MTAEQFAAFKAKEAAQAAVKKKEMAKKAGKVQDIYDYQTKGKKTFAKLKGDAASKAPKSWFGADK